MYWSFMKHLLLEKQHILLPAYVKYIFNTSKTISYLKSQKNPLKISVKPCLLHSCKNKITFTKKAFCLILFRLTLSKSMFKTWSFNRCRKKTALIENSCTFHKVAIMTYDFTLYRVTFLENITKKKKRGGGGGLGLVTYATEKNDMMVIKY